MTSILKVCRIFKTPVRFYHWTSVMLNDFSRFPVPDVQTLPDDIKTVMETTKEKSGFFPNVFSAMSYRPDEARAFIQYYDAVMAVDRGNLTKADKEMIILATSSENNCLYCIIAHGALHRIFSKNPHLADQIAANWKTADLDDRQRAILDVAMDLCRCQPLSEDKIENLRKHGLDKDDLWDIGAVTALFALSNRMAYLMNLKPNEEFYLMGRIPKQK
ncbi:uncharacterized protein LOC125658296 [Ostrea edulis]|uniref:uncharacterized protein LOC125658296 n=1 Tax=Ostrea edulis TaxID=37623 RepID=UPI002095CCD0|nr:uncharacterized protein LOC125658296 [Ostrea edulis]